MTILPSSCLKDAQYNYWFLLLEKAIFCKKNYLKYILPTNFLKISPVSISIVQAVRLTPSTMPTVLGLIKSCRRLVLKRWFNCDSPLLIEPPNNRQAKHQAPWTWVRRIWGGWLRWPRSGKAWACRPVASSQCGGRGRSAGTRDWSCGGVRSYRQYHWFMHVPQPLPWKCPVGCKE